MANRLTTTAKALQHLYHRAINNLPADIAEPEGPFTDEQEVEWYDLLREVKGTSGYVPPVPAPPTIFGLNPVLGRVGASVTITGTNLAGTTSVKFNGTNASFTNVNSTTVKASVPVSASTGPISVTTPGGTVDSVAFTVVVAGVSPAITSFSPLLGSIGESVTITGTNFGNAAGAAGLVKFNGTVAVPTSWSTTSITVLIPDGATIGALTVTTATGTAPSTTNFQVVIDVGMIEGQSNDSGLAPQKDWPASYKNPYPKTPIWNDDAGEAQPLWMGYNEAGLNGNAGYPDPPGGYPYTRFDGVSIPASLAGFYDGAGMEFPFAKRWAIDHANDDRKLYFFKQNVEHATNTNGASIARWQNEIFAINKGEFLRLKAWAASQGWGVRVLWRSFGVKESEGGNPNYVPDMHALQNRFITEGIDNPETVVFIPRAPQINSQSVAGYQQQLVAAYPDRYKLYQYGGTTYLADRVHFDQPSTEVWGNKLYDLANNIQGKPIDTGDGYALELGYLQYQHAYLQAPGATTTSTKNFMVGCAVRLDYLDTISPSTFASVFSQGTSRSTGPEGLTCNIDQSNVSFRLQKADNSFSFLNFSRATIAAQGVLLPILASFDGQNLKVIVGSSGVQTQYVGQSLRGTLEPTRWGGLFYDNSGEVAKGYSVEGGIKNIVFFNRAATSEAEMAGIIAKMCRLTPTQYGEAACSVYGLENVTDQNATSFTNLASSAAPITVTRYA